MIDPENMPPEQEQKKGQASAGSNDSQGVQGDELWTHDIFGCFGDPGLCICTFFVPCYTMGRNAMSFKEDGLIIGLLYGLGFIGLGPMLRWRIRQKRNIRGSMVSDVLAHWLCPCCALIQENKELYGLHGSHLGEKVPLANTITRQ